MLGAVGLIACCGLIGGCANHSTCHLPSTPPVGSSGPVVIVRGETGGGSLSTTFGGRTWSKVAPDTPASTAIMGDATVVAANPNPFLRVKTTDGRMIELQLVLAACA